MIEIREKQTSKGKARYELFIDNLLVDKVEIHSNNEGSSIRYEIKTNDYEITSQVLSHSLSEFPPLSELEFKYKIDWLEVVRFFSIEYDTDDQVFEGSCSILNLSSWRMPYRFQDYFQLLLTSYEASGGKGIHFHVYGANEDSVISNFGISFDCSFDLPIISELNRVFNTLRPFHEEVDRLLRQQTGDNSITVSFDFPLEIRTACEQYLLYFVQFLRDLGVEANTALTHEAGQVLFTVTPEDKDQALDKIRAALDVYLHLPSNPVSDSNQSEIAILRLNSELQNFQSKLSMARAEIQMKEAAIQLQKVTIAQLTGEIVFESIKDITPKPKDKDKEELLGDIVSLVPIKGKGLEINLPELFRKLKRFLNDEE